MGKTSGHILKSTDVKLEGRIRLDTEHTNTSGTAKQSAKKNMQVTTPQAHIIENNPDFIVIELTCSCGTKTHIKCKHSDSRPANQISKQT